MENSELLKWTEPPSGGLAKLRLKLDDEAIAEREELTWLRYAVVALFIAVSVATISRLDLPARQPHAPVRSDLVAGQDPVRVFSSDAVISRLSGLTQKVQIFWLSPEAEAQPSE